MHLPSSHPGDRVPSEKGREGTDLHYRALVAPKLRRRRRLIYSCELTNLA